MVTYPVDPRRLKEHCVSVCIHSMFRERRRAAFNFAKTVFLISQSTDFPFRFVSSHFVPHSTASLRYHMFRVVTYLLFFFFSQGDLHCILLARITYTSDSLNFNWCTQHCTLPKSPTPVLYNLDQQYNNPYLANSSLVSSWYFYLSVCH